MALSVSMLRLEAYKRGSLQDARSLLTEAKRSGLTVEDVLQKIDQRLSGWEAVETVIKAQRAEQLCPKCKRFVMIPPKGVTEPVVVCPSCRYSVYEGVR